MTKVMKLNVTYYGNYGGDVDETMVLPIDINGVLFEELEEKDYENAVYLGEIEGKHSECYGDLSVEFVNLSELDVKQVTELIKQSNFSEFECYFEGIEEDFREESDQYSEEEEKRIVELYKMEPTTWSIKTGLIYEKFIEQIEHKYVDVFKTITVLEKEYKHAVDILRNNEINTFE